MSDLAFAQMARAHGEPVDVEWPQDGGYDPTTREVVGSLESEFDVQALVESVSDRLVNGVTILPGDRFVTLPGPSIRLRPVVGCRVTLAGCVYDVLRVEELRTQGSAVAFKLHVRGPQA